jgi:hypothetical protein
MHSVSAKPSQTLRKRFATSSGSAFTLLIRSSILRRYFGFRWSPASREKGASCGNEGSLRITGSAIFIVAAAPYYIHSGVMSAMTKLRDYFHAGVPDMMEGGAAASATGGRSQVATSATISARPHT